MALERAPKVHPWLPFIKSLEKNSNIMTKSLKMVQTLSQCLKKMTTVVQVEGKNLELIDP